MTKGIGITPSVGKAAFFRRYKNISNPFKNIKKQVKTGVFISLGYLKNIFYDDRGNYKPVFRM